MDAPVPRRHLAAVHALGITHGLLAVTPLGPGRSGRGPGARPLGRLAATSLGDVEAVAVSGPAPAWACPRAPGGPGPAGPRSCRSRTPPRPGPAVGGPRGSGSRAAATVVNRDPAGRPPSAPSRNCCSRRPWKPGAGTRHRDTEAGSGPGERGVARVGAETCAARKRVAPRARHGGWSSQAGGRWPPWVDVRLAATGDRPPAPAPPCTRGRPGPTAHLRAAGRAESPGSPWRSRCRCNVGDRLLLRDPGSAAAAFAQPDAGAGAGQAAARQAPAQRAWPPLVGAIRAGTRPPPAFPPPGGRRRSRPGTGRRGRPYPPRPTC